MSRSRSRSPAERRGPPPNSEDLFSVVISGIPRDFKEDDLRDEFEKFGKIGDIFVPRDRYEGGNRGFGFVRFVEKDPLRLDGKEVKIEAARDRPKPGRPGWDPERARRDRDRRERRYRSRSRSRSRDRRRRSRSRSRDRYRSRRDRSRSRDR